MLITGGMIQKILTKQMMMIFLLIRTLTGTHKHIIYLDMKYGNRVLNKGQKRLPSFRFTKYICFIVGRCSSTVQCSEDQKYVKYFHVLCKQDTFLLIN